MNDVMAISNAREEATALLESTRKMLSTTDLSNIQPLIDAQKHLDFAVASQMLDAKNYSGTSGAFWRMGEEVDFDGSSTYMEALSLFILEKAGHPEFYANYASQFKDHGRALTIITIFELLGKVWNRPEMALYVTVGLWDEDFITQCIEDGIDPQMAVRLR